ncbi:hypothetical protein ABKN59_003429 [Abortiporus biennis]
MSSSSNHATSAVDSSTTGLTTLLVVLALLLFASLAWCMISSCLGRSLRESISGLWSALINTPRATGQRDWRRRAWNDHDGHLHDNARDKLTYTRTCHIFDISSST